MESQGSHAEPYAWIVNGIEDDVMISAALVSMGGFVLS